MYINDIIKLEQLHRLAIQERLTIPIRPMSTQ
jgi:hypothetical protein